MANKVAMAVRVTDRAELPFAKWVIKLEMLPPGQAATINMPRAILGSGCAINTNKKVMVGSSTN